MITRFYRLMGGFEHCFYVETDAPLTAVEFNAVGWIIAETYEQHLTARSSHFSDQPIVEIGPRLGVETAFSSNAVDICRNAGIDKVKRVECSTRYLVTDAMPQDRILAEHMDFMMQQHYLNPLGADAFSNLKAPEPMEYISLLGLDGKEVLGKVNGVLGLGMDEDDTRYYVDMYRRYGRSSTNVELMQIGNCNSEHCRHGFFRGIMVIDGTPMPETLLDLVRAPLLKLGTDHNSIAAFNDNAGVIRGTKVLWLKPKNPGQASSFVLVPRFMHITHTGETHNNPTMIAPFPGAETGTGGRIRDNAAVGRGGLIIAGAAGYCVGNLHLPGYEITGEATGHADEALPCASPRKILIEASNGCSSYGNKFGEAVICGFARTFGLIVDGQRREFLKPILFSAGQGRIPDIQVKKREPEKGMLIVRSGGPAFRIGVGGGSASSISDGSNTQERDRKSVQRGNPQAGNRTVRALRACIELEEDNPIENLHDQGAGGPSNVLTELMNPVGGRVDIRKIRLGDRTMSVLEIWVGEYQEGFGLLTRLENLPRFQAICERENVNCEVLGEITGDGRVVVLDPENGTTPVDLKLEDILGNLPQKTFKLKRRKRQLQPLALPGGLTIARALRETFRLPQVGSKGYLTRKVDRSVTGLIARQQCCGRVQIPVADCGVTADGYFGVTGASMVLGEQPIKLMIDSAAGVRMAAGELFMNKVGAGITRRADIKCRVNCMWPAKLDGEGPLLYDAYLALRDILIALGIAADGGKDSLSMSVKINGTHVKSPPQIVIFGSAPVPDIEKVVTPDFKRGDSAIGFIDLGNGKNRMGGSSLAQAFGQVGDQSPDVDDPQVLAGVFDALTELVKRGCILAIHDRSDGGLITTVAEMCMAGLKGACINIPGKDQFAELFSEELGVVFEFRYEDSDAIKDVLAAHGVEKHYRTLGHTMDELFLSVNNGGHELYSESISTLRTWWEATSDRLEQLQANPEAVASEARGHNDYPVEHTYKLTFTPTRTPDELIGAAGNPKVAVLREEGTNGDREMVAACAAAGLDPMDVNMKDLLNGKASLDEFQGLVFPGGFSFMDVFGSAKGWAAIILQNNKLKGMFDRFYARPDTFSLGVCNGCQLMALLGWVPFRGLDGRRQPRFVHNASGRFESRWSQVRINQSPSVLLRGMEDSSFGIWVAHGEGQLVIPDKDILPELFEKKLVPITYVTPYGHNTVAYPSNPNGSSRAEAALCSPDGRHLAMMPHPERCFRQWQWAWMPPEWKQYSDATPWLTMFQNARIWCLGHKQ